MRKPLRAIGKDYAASETFALSFQEGDDVEEVFEGVPLSGFEEITMRKEPFVAGSGIKPGAANIGGKEHGTGAVLCSCKGAAEGTPVTAELAQLHEFIVSDEPQGTLSTGKTESDISSVIAVGFPPFPPKAGQFRSVGDIDAIDTGAKPIDKPFDEADRFDSHPAGSGQSSQPLLDFTDALGADLEGIDDDLIGIDSHKADGFLVQIHAAERSELRNGILNRDVSVSTNTNLRANHGNLRVGGQKKLMPERAQCGKYKPSRWPLHGFTLIELLVMIAIISVLAGMLLSKASIVFAIQRQISFLLGIFPFHLL